MKRREFLCALGGAAAVQLCASPYAVAQQPNAVRRLGIVTIYEENTAEAQQNLAALRVSLAEHGWVEGRNLRVEYRFRAGNPDRAQSAAAELVALSPDVILAHGTPATTALRNATHTIPIIFTVVADPVGAGLVESLARPGGNVTGFSTFEPEIGGKWLQLLREVNPELRRVAGIVDSPFLAFMRLWRATEKSANDIGLETTTVNFHQPSENLESAIDAFASKPDGALVVLPTAINNVSRARIFSVALHHRLPAIYAFTHFAADGGLMTYGIDNTRAFANGASYVDRILKGERPADLPVQEPTRYELVLNQRSAKAIGLNFPSTLLARADQVIE